MALSPIYSRLPPAVDIRSMGMSNFGLLVDIIFPGWQTSGQWQLQAGVVSTPPFLFPSGVTDSAFVGITSDNASGVWLLPWNGTTGAQVDHIWHAVILAPVSGYALPSGKFFNGLGSLGANPYFVEASGGIYTVSGGAVTLLSTFPSGSISLAADSSVNKIYSINPVNHNFGAFQAWTLGTFATSGNVLGSIQGPITGAVTAGVNWAPITCIAAGNGNAAAGGWQWQSVPSGFNSVAFQPSLSFFVGITPSTSGLSLWNFNSSGLPTFAQLVSGIGSANYLTWSPDGSQVYLCSPTGNLVSIYNFSLGTLSFSQTLSVSGANRIAVLSTMTDGLICEAAQNLVQPIHKTASWAVSGSALAIGNPQSVIATSSTSMIVGCVSGLVPVTFNGTIWTTGAATGIGFVPNYLAIDIGGNILAASSGGAIYTQGVSGTFSTSSVVGMSYDQGQMAIADATNALARIFGFIPGTLSQQGSLAIPTPTAMVASGGFALLAGSATSYILQFVAPFTIAPVRHGYASIYNGAWTTTDTGIGGIPTAMAFDPSGNVSVALSNNNLYTIGLSGLVSSGTITQFSGQSQNTPYGIPSLAWIGGHLYGTSMLNSSIVEIE